MQHRLRGTGYLRRMCSGRESIRRSHELHLQSQRCASPASPAAFSLLFFLGAEFTKGHECISLGDIQNVPTRSKFAIFQGFLTFWSNALKFRSIGGGMCMLFEICEKRLFQKCMGWGGVGDHIFEY